ncbi:flavin reductase family protein [Poseidonocella sp. HB161398]|uniref:flavin reductase family protein n=1 Tax=Poseidonocella sp. HB161398 TaxID=2320855 RepID=UPI001109AD0D|nr:flavin reductase family protein [Poseidonocella sp. HB161398]
MTDRTPPVEAAAFRAAMRLPATAVTVIATGSGEDRMGLTASAVCSLSDAPPMILACVNRASPVLPAIRANGCFSANFLTEAQSALAMRFAGMTKVYGAERFDGSAWHRLATGAPVLEDALSVFDCHLDCEHDSPTHAILIGRVAAIRQNDGARSLVYTSGTFSTPAALSA